MPIFGVKSSFLKLVILAVQKRELIIEEVHNILSWISLTTSLSEFDTADICSLIAFLSFSSLFISLLIVT